MTSTSGDHLVRAVGLGGRARAVVAVTTDTVEELRRMHDPSPQVAAAIGRLATGALLLASSLEKVTNREPLLTVELEGGGPAGRLVATASPLGWVRATVSNPLAATDPRDDGTLEVSGVVGTEGQLIVTRDHPDPIALALDSPALRLVQRVRAGELVAESPGRPRDSARPSKTLARNAEPTRTTKKSSADSVF